LNKLEGGTGTVALLFCELVPFVQTTFAVLQLLLAKEFLQENYTHLFLDRHS
jgi:hypothetical protein